MIRFITLHPGHFHAALVHKEMYAGVDRRVHVYAPLGPGLQSHLEKLTQFNTRGDEPTQWEVEVHSSHDFLERMARERPGNVVVLAGHNATKLQAIEIAIGAGLHVLADKPWVLFPEQLARLREVLQVAHDQNLIACDIMTERYEITSILQRELVQDHEIFGDPLTGSVDQPAVVMESVHYLKKRVAGTPLRRPAVFFDVDQQGEGLSDVGTHLVDLVPWALFPDKPIDDAAEINLHSARRWPTALSREDFQQITGESDFPAWLKPSLDRQTLNYFCNTQVVYQVRGRWVKLDVLWGKEAEPGAGDTHLAIFQGSRSRIEIRQGPDEKYRPELYVVPEGGSAKALVKAVENRLSALAGRFSGLSVVGDDRKLHVLIPDVYRAGHEAHFAEVTRQFLRYVRGEEPVPAWEKANMSAKYRVTTEGVALARRSTMPPT